jgi:rhodanese-related sulfurtransferase
MKHAYHAIAVVVFLALAGCSGGPGNPPAVVATEIRPSASTLPPGATAAPPVVITPAEAYSKWQQGAFFVDVRSQIEWDGMHVPGSVLIPLAELQTRVDEVPGSKDVVVVCYGGVLSRKGAGLLQQAGFTRVSYVRGGLGAWTDAGYPVDRAP